jgi:hypothetical protein
MFETYGKELLSDDLLVHIHSDGLSGIGILLL